MSAECVSDGIEEGGVGWLISELIVQRVPQHVIKLRRNDIANAIHVIVVINVLTRASWRY